MKSIAQMVVDKPLKPKKKERAPGSAKAEQIENLMVFMGEPPKPPQAKNASKTAYGNRFKYWLGRTRHLEPDQIYRMIERAKKFTKNPKALFNKMLGESKIAKCDRCGREIKADGTTFTEGENCYKVCGICKALFRDWWRMPKRINAAIKKVTKSEK